MNDKAKEILDLLLQGDDDTNTPGMQERIRREASPEKTTEYFDHALQGASNIIAASLAFSREWVERPTQTRHVVMNTAEGLAESQVLVARSCMTIERITDLEPNQNLLDDDEVFEGDLTASEFYRKKVLKFVVNIIMRWAGIVTGSVELSEVFTDIAIYGMSDGEHDIDSVTWADLDPVRLLAAFQHAVANLNDTTKNLKEIAEKKETLDDLFDDFQPMSYEWRSSV